jgi:hypothetical protein
MGKRIRNGEEYLSLRVARKKYHCEVKHSGCIGLIEPGAQYVPAELPPNSDIGNDRWWRMPICAPCGEVSLVAEQLFGYTIPVTEWLIWSNHHKCWWGPGGSGYRHDISNAGRYALADTGQWLGRGCGCCPAPEVLVPAPGLHLLATPGALASYATSAIKEATRRAGLSNRYAEAVSA